jgi:hypothetical protein
VEFGFNIRNSIFPEEILGIYFLSQRLIGAIQSYHFLLQIAEPYDIPVLPGRPPLISEKNEEFLIDEVTYYPRGRL